MLKNNLKENPSLNSDPGKSGKWSTLLRLIRFTAPHKWAIFLLLIMGFINVGLNVLKPLPVKFIIDNVLLNHPLSASLQTFFDRIGEVPDRMELLTILIVVSVTIVISAS